MALPTIGTQWSFSGENRVQWCWGFCVFSAGLLLHGKPYDTGFMRAVSTSGGFFLVTHWAIMKPWSTAYSTKAFPCYNSYKPTHLAIHKSESLHNRRQSSLLYTHLHTHTDTLFSFYLLAELQKRRAHFCADGDLIISRGLLSKEIHVFIHRFRDNSRVESTCKHADLYSNHSLLERKVLLPCTSNRAD